MENFVFGPSRSFRQTVDKTDQFAKTPWPVLLLGETGSGKELLARRLHDRSPRAGGPFIPLNCGALPPSLFESELFGYERGAFSGAVSTYRGLARHAHGGTLFLDEVGDLDLSLQVKLLRLIEKGEVRSVGSSKIEYVDIRIVAATNVDLFQAVAEGKFRLDLLERLSVLTLRVPPLRERPEDLSILAKSFLVELGTHWDDGVFETLKSFCWPGNVRQLKNVLIRASVLGEKKVSSPLLSNLLQEEDSQLQSSRLSKNTSFLNGRLEDIERKIIIERLKRLHGNRKRTAEDLGIAKSTLHEKLRRWKLEDVEGILPAHGLPDEYTVSA
jgi:transcriptional regulator with PAS, ATPase and Fis domain